MSKHWFLFGLVAAAVLAGFFPEPGARGGWMRPEHTSKLGVALVFFLHGAAMSFATLRDGSLRWRLHVLVQAVTFLLFPLMGLTMFWGLRGMVSMDVRLGLFFLCAAPSTISSSVTMTALARGNVAGALFNATLSSLIGVVLTPLWVALVLSASGQSPSLLPVLRDLALWLLLPLAAGQGVRPLIGDWVGRHRAGVGTADRLVILFLVYTSFCDSFVARVWSGQSPVLLMLVVCMGIGLLGTAMLVLSKGAGFLGLPRGDRIAALMCGSQKSLASGIPMAKLLFAAHPGLGIIVIPIMVYHAMQLFVGAAMAGGLARGDGADDPDSNERTTDNS